MHPLQDDRPLRRAARETSFADEDCTSGSKSRQRTVTGPSVISKFLSVGTQVETQVGPIVVIVVMHFAEVSYEALVLVSVSFGFVLLGWRKEFSINISVFRAQKIFLTGRGERIDPGSDVLRLI